MNVMDLHVHTYYSDGTYSPERVVREAKARGVDTMALTDHDGLFGLEEGRMAGEQFGVTVIGGIEFSAELWTVDEDMIFLHLLGYGMDTENPLLRKQTEELQLARRQRNRRIMTALQDKGYALTWEDLQVHPQQTYVGKPNFARALVKKGYAETVRMVFDSEIFFRSPEIRGIHRVKIAVEEAIALLHQAGGKAVLAHPLKVSYGRTHHEREDSNQKREEEDSVWMKLDHLLDRLCRVGLDGMECYYSSHTKEETERLLAMADQHNLLVSAGTDFHGPDVDAMVQIGSFAVVPDGRRLTWLQDLQK